jgi:drug/metabolite transporter (DMT)-like permease
VTFKTTLDPFVSGVLASNACRHVAAWYTVSMSNAYSHLWPGVPLALGAAILFGASTPLSKLLMGSVDPWLLAGILYLGAGLGLAFVQYGRHLFRLPTAEAALQKTDLPWLAAVIVFGGMLGPLLLMLGLSRSSAASGALLLNLEGLATMAIAWIVFRENVDRRLLLGALAILCGAVLLSWNGRSFGLDAGGLLIAAACLCWGIDNNLTRKLSAADPVQIAMVKGLVAGAVNVALALWLGAALPDARLLAAGATVGFLGVGVSLVMFVLGLRHLGTARTGAYFSLAPFIGAVLALVVFGEPVTVSLLAAGLLMALGLWLHLAERHDHAHFHDLLEHDHVHSHDEHHQHTHDGPVSEPHSHWHRHDPMHHRHPHFPDLHHRHDHASSET